MISFSSFGKSLGTPILCALGTLLLFLIWTAPLSSHWTSGIPSSASNIESPPWRIGIAGDHLQLLYHFDLMADMVSGQIPWFTNPYEFNTGSDEARFRPGAYFAPMSLVYTALRPWLGQAAAWNTVLWISVWMSAWFGVLWLRTFSFHRVSVWLGVMFLLFAPFRWATLLGGSPAGIALMWVPFFLWRLNLGLLTPRIRDGFLIGLGIILLFWGDLQVFYFTSLFAPVFALITIGWLWQDIRPVLLQWWKLFPGGLAGLSVIALLYRWRKTYISGSLMSGGRSWHELALYSPQPSDLLSSRPGPGETVYIGILIFILLGVCLGCGGWAALRSRNGTRWARSGVYLGVLGVLAFGICLSLGTNGPAGGGAIRLTRAAIPYFDMIRQSFKIFAVVPVLMAWVLAGGTSVLFQTFSTRFKFSPWLAGVFLTAVMFFQYSRHIHATICLLPSPDEAYATIALDAEQQGVGKPRILVIPLWPGDSAETSMPMHLAQAHHLRMVNGYSPVVDAGYFEEVFRSLESINQGLFTDAQAAKLEELGVSYLVVHEDRFPEKVSPFPIWKTLRDFEANPHLKPLAQSGPVHAYALIPNPFADISPPSSVPDLRFPARRYSGEHLPGTGEVVQAPDAHGGAFRRLLSDDEVKTPPARIATDPDNHWWMRLRGKGRLQLGTALAESTPSPADQTLNIDSSSWEWHKIPLQADSQFGPREFTLRATEGNVDLDLILLSGSQHLLDIPSEGLRLPARLFFHGGFALANGGVRFRPDHDPDRVVFYGPMLPLSPGTYRFRLRHRAAEDSGNPFGELRSGFHGQPPLHELPVVGDSTEWTWRVEENLPWRVEFVYNRAAEIDLLDLEIQRVDEASDPVQR